MASLLGRSLVSVALRRSFSTLVKPTLTSCSRIPAIRCALPSQTTRVDVRFGGGGVDYEAKPVASFKRGDYEYHAVKLLKAFGNVDAEKVRMGVTVMYLLREILLRKYAQKSYTAEKGNAMLMLSIL